MHDFSNNFKERIKGLNVQSISDKILTVLNSAFDSVQQDDGKVLISFKEFEGEVFIHLKIESEKETYYYVSKPFFLDHVAPVISLSDKNNEN